MIKKGHVVKLAGVDRGYRDTMYVASVFTNDDDPKEQIALVTWRSSNGSSVAQQFVDTRVLEIIED